MLELEKYKDKIFLDEYPRPDILSDDMTKEATIQYLYAVLKEKNQRHIGENEDLRLALRAQMVMHMPTVFDADFIGCQDRLLWTETVGKGIVNCDDLKYQDGIALWHGDITRLNADAIVNAANKEMLGCFAPDHLCIDNVIHAAGGLQIRKDCDTLMKLQGHTEPTGSAKITSAYNLPSKYILHTVGPIILEKLAENDFTLLKDCYISCLELAKRLQLRSVAFCCISTGVFRFPGEQACAIAVKTVKEWLSGNRDMRVIFDVFSQKDEAIYEHELGLSVNK